MARTKGAKNTTTLIAEGKLPPEAIGWSAEQKRIHMFGGIVATQPEQVDTRTDAEILYIIRERFEMYERLVTAMCRGMMRSCIFSGSPGVGKTFLAVTTLEAQKLMNPDFQYYHVKGTVSAFKMFELGYTYRHKGNVILLDDSDSILNDEEGMNILKALLDSGENRRVTWMTDNAAFRGEDSQLPRDYEFNGSVAVVSNVNFELELGARRRGFEHLEALLDRSIYLDLAIHDRRAVMVWVTHIIRHAKLLQKLGLTAEQENEVVDWIRENQARLKELSLRTPHKIGQMVLMSDSYHSDVNVDWRRLAATTMLRRGVD